MSTAELKEEYSSLPPTTLLDSRWAAVEGIIASRNFAKSGRLSAFLIYVVRCAIENRPEEITEQQIGVHVFGRTPGYNPSEDNIVRTTARQLRQRLALYYQEDGSADTLRIEIPRGGYTPVFQTHESRSLDAPEPAAQFPAANFSAAQIPISPTVSDSPVEAHALMRSHKLSWLSIAALLLAGATLALGIEAGMNALRLRTAPTDALWRTLFSARQTTIFVPGDAGLNMFNNQNRAPRQVGLNDYIGGKYLYSPKAQSPEFAGVPIASRRYVNITDLLLADRIGSLARIHRQNYQIRFPRDLTPDDFRNINVILSGAPVYNPWDELFDTRLNFHIVYDGEANNSMFVENRKPQSGEQPVYTASLQHVFGYIALTDNLDNNGKVLLVEGTSHVGVEAAYDFLFNDGQMAPILAQSRKNGASPRNFEVLLEATNINGTESGESRVLATRYY